VFPGIDVLPVRLGDRVRIRIANLTMTNHPIHLHGHHFAVGCTDGGWVPESAQWPETTIDIPVGSIRAIEFVADNPGDWAFHCHKSHHTMNAMGHDVANFIGMHAHDLHQAVSRAAPGAMAMGTTGMAEMAQMSMKLPPNTLPMMTGTGPFGPIEMGGMFTVMKVREGLAPGDYRCGRRPDPRRRTAPWKRDTITTRETRLAWTPNPQSSSLSLCSSPARLRSPMRAQPA
jgi:hypothetical protein